MVEVSDVIIQVLDARDPLACRSPEVERFVRRANPDKRVVLLLNKIDLAPKENVQAWLKYFREEMPCVAFKCATGGGGGGGDKLGARSLPTKGSYGGKDALGGETLLQLLKNYARNRNLKTAITVGIVGFPNVGKSSLINSLKRSRSAAAVGNTPGMTKVSKEIVLDKHVKLIDSPGVVFASSLGESAGVTALRNCVKVERLADPIAPVCEILRRCPQEQLMLMYKIGAFDDVDAFLRAVGKTRGVLKKGGVPDMLAAARVVLNDWNGGRIPYYTTPPARGDAVDRKHAAAEVVGDWGKEFDAEKVFEDEENAVIAGLPELDDADVEFVPAQTAGVAQLDAAGEEAASDSEGGEEEMEEEEEEEEASEDEMDQTASGATEAALDRAAGKARREGTGADEKKAQYARGARFCTAQRASSIRTRPAPRRRRRRRLRRRLPRRGGGRQRVRFRVGGAGVNPLSRAKSSSVCLLSQVYFQKVDYVSTFFYGPEDVPLAYTRVSVVSSTHEARQVALSRRFVRLPRSAAACASVARKAPSPANTAYSSAPRASGFRSSWCHVQNIEPRARGRRRPRAPPARTRRDNTTRRRRRRRRR